MTINLLAPTVLPSATLVADSITTASGATNSIPILTTAGGFPISACLELQSVLGGFVLPRMTTAQRNVLRATPGMQIYNTDTGAVNLRDNTNSWIVGAGSGTVTSVDVAPSGSGITFSGGPITGSGTITATLSTALQSLSDLVLEGILVKTPGNGMITRALETTNSSWISISNADGVAGNPIIGLVATGITAGSYTNADVTVGLDGRIYAIASGGGSGGAPSNGTYIVQVPSAFLPDAQPLSALSTGIVKNTTTTGVLSIATAGTDYYSVDNPTRILDSGFAVGNFFIGSGSGNLTLTSAEFNTGVGVNALNAIDTGIQNTFGGHSAGILLVSGRYNTGWGELCLASLVSLDSCTALGFNAGNALVTGGGIVALGANAISATTSATNGFALGRDTVMGNGLTNAGVIGYAATISVSNAINIGNGCKIGFSVASPLYNLDVGTISSVSAIKVADSSLTPATPASGSVFYSVSGVPFSLSSSGTPLQYYIDGNPIYIKVGTTSGSQNSIYMGQFINANTASITLPRSVVIGNNALLNGTTGAADIVAIGYRAGLAITTGTNIVAIGASSLITGTNSASNIIAIGRNSLFGPTTLNGNIIAIGNSAGPFQVCGTSIVIGDTAANNIRNTTDTVVIGNAAGTTGSINSFSQSVAIGALAASTSTIGISLTHMTYLGYNTNCGASAGPIDNSTAIGANTAILISDAMNLGNGCVVGINNSSPVYNLDIANVSNICATKLAVATTTPTSATSGSITYTYTATTSGTTDLALPLFTLPTNKAATVEVLIRGFDSTFTDFTGGSALAGVMRGAGNIALVGTPDYVKFVSTIGDFAISVDTGAQTAVLNATGIVAVDYTWVIEVKYIIL